MSPHREVAERAPEAPSLASRRPVPGVIDLRDGAASVHFDEHELLEQVVAALNAPLELKEVLRLLGDIALEASDAERFSLFLLDGRQLVPAVAIGPRHDERLWQAFCSMGPIDLEPSQWSAIAGSGGVAIHDARGSDLIPADWVAQFSLRTLVLVPLRARGELRGLMALDWSDVREVPDRTVAVLETLASYVAVAVKTAIPLDAVERRAQLQETLAHAAKVLASPLPPSEIVDHLSSAYMQLLDPAVCGVALVDADQATMTTVASPNRPELKPIALSEIPDHLLQLLGDTWAEDKRPIALGDDPWLSELLDGDEAGATSYVALPLLCDGHTRGGVLLGFAGDAGLDSEAKAAAQSLAAIGTAALERHELLTRLDRQVDRLDVLYHASRTLADGADAAALVAKLTEALASHGIEVSGLTFRDRRLKRFFGGAPPTDEEREAWRNDEPSAVLADGSLAVPMRIGPRLVGALRVRPADLDAEQVSFLEALAGELAEVAMRRALRSEVEEAARERAVTAERERFAADLHDTAGQVFVAMNLLARALAESVPPDTSWATDAARLAELADQGNGAIDDAVRALAFFPVARRGLVPSLRALAASIGNDSGLDIAVDVHGRARRLPANVQRAFYRVAHEAITNAWRHANCATVRVELEMTSRQARLRVTDNGVGLSAEPQPGLHIGLTSMRRAVDEIAGVLEIGDADPHGTMVEAAVDLKA